MNRTSRFLSPFSTRPVDRALGGDALLSVLDGAQQGHVDLPAAISLGVSMLLVLCMDVAMLYAASMLRLLGMRRAEPRTTRLHRGVMATVAVLEAGTYAYMAWRYETPASVVAWALILSRALAAPLLPVYLAMARPLPVTARDILAQVELASGLGLIRDAVTIANDASASMMQKVALFGASAVMTPQDRERLDGLLTAVEAQRSPHEAVSLPPGAAVDLPNGGGPEQRPFRPQRESAQWLTVALVSGGAPPTQGRTWTVAEYAARDARLDSLGIRPRWRTRTG
jgi:hypothetical protein